MRPAWCNPVFALLVPVFALAVPAFGAVGILTFAGFFSDSEDMKKLGSVSVDHYTGHVFFNDPADDGKSYRVDVAIPKPWNAPGIKTERIELWLLARGGKALTINSQPEGDVLIEAGSGGATANAIYFFDRSVEPKDLTAVVVSVDGQPTIFKIATPK